MKVLLKNKKLKVYQTLNNLIPYTVSLQKTENSILLKSKEEFTPNAKWNFTNYYTSSSAEE